MVVMDTKSLVPTLIYSHCSPYYRFRIATCYSSHLGDHLKEEDLEYVCFLCRLQRRQCPLETLCHMPISMQGIAMHWAGSRRKPRAGIDGRTRE